MKKLIILLLAITLIVIAVLASLNFGLFTVNANQTGTNGGDGAWHVIVDGSVSQSLNLTIADLQAMPETDVTAAIYCVDAPTTVVTQGTWQGVQLSKLLDQAGVLPSAVKVAFYASDGYTTDLPLDTARGDNIILAYAKDGAPLTEVLRLVVPDQFGYKWIAQVTKIELVNYDFKGTWESQGYPDDATATITATNNNGPSPTYDQPPQNLPSATASPSATPKTTQTAATATPTPTNATAQSAAPSPLGVQTSNNLNMIEAVGFGFVAVAAVVLFAVARRKNRVKPETAQT